MISEVHRTSTYVEYMDDNRWSSGTFKERLVPCIGGPLDGKLATPTEVGQEYRRYNTASGTAPKTIFIYTKNLARAFFP